MSKPGVLLLCVLFLCSGHPGIAGTFDSGSDGSGGGLVVVSSQSIDLAAASVGPAMTPGSGNGIYDPDLCLVVFKFTTVHIQEMATLSFLNHPTGAAVVILASGDVTIDGHINLDGEDGQGIGRYSEPGPGGFAGGATVSGPQDSSPGFGPGGGCRNPDANQLRNGGGGGYATAGEPGNAGGGAGGSCYGNIFLLPLIGGSGGGGGNGGRGGAGGGAILIASSTIVDLGPNDLTMSIFARGGDGSGFQGAPLGGSGSGGSIRIMANEIRGSGRLCALGGVNSQEAGVDLVATGAFVWRHLR